MYFQHLHGFSGCAIKFNNFGLKICGKLLYQTPPNFIYRSGLALTAISTVSSLKEIKCVEEDEKEKPHSVQLNSSNQTQATNLFHMRVVPQSLVQAVPEPLSFADHLLQEGRLGNDVHDFQGCMAYQGAACKGGTMVSGLHGICHVLPDQQRTNGQTTCMSPELKRPAFSGGNKICNISEYSSGKPKRLLLKLPWPTTPEEVVVSMHDRSLRGSRLQIIPATGR